MPHARAVEVTPDGVAVTYMAPAADLAEWVIDYALYDSGPAGSRVRLNRYLPGPANVALVFDAPPLRVRIRNRRYDPAPAALLFGPTSQLIEVESDGGRLVGFGVTPLGWARLFGIDAADAANRVVALADLWGEGPTAALVAALAPARDPAAVAAALDTGLRRLARPPIADEERIRALTRLILDPAIDDSATAAAALGFTLPRLRRLAKAHFGFTPKLLMRRTRFLRALMEVVRAGDAADFARVAPTYYDRSHFIKDAQLFLGMTARQFAVQMTPLMDAMRRGRRRRFGQPLQSLIAAGRDNVAAAPGVLDGAGPAP
jgi:hypothetical protein